MGEMKKQMLRGELYVADDPELAEDFARAEALLVDLNAVPNSEPARRLELLRRLLGEAGDGVEVRSPFLCEYGTRVAIGARTFINFDCLMLDVALGAGAVVVSDVPAGLVAAGVPARPLRRSES